MFEIDLRQGAHPTSAAATRGNEAEQIIVSLAPVVLGVLVLVAGMLLVNRWLDGSIREQEQRLAAAETALSESRQRLAEMSGKRRVLYDVARQEIYWSDELRLISEKLPDKAWITSMRVVSSGPSKGPNGEAIAPVASGVAIDGGVLSNSSEGNLDVIGKFIENLSADPRFQQSFAGATLESVQRSSDPFALGFHLRLDFKS